MSLPTKTDNRKKDIFILWKGPTQESGHTLSAENMYLINFTWKNKKFCLSLHYKKIVTNLLMTPKLLNLNQKIPKLLHIHYA